MSRAVFIDKDGTLVYDVPYNVDPGLVRFMPGALQSLSAFKEAGFKLFLVTNQSGLAKKKFSPARLQRLFDHISNVLADEGLTLDGIYHCPHDGSEATPCNCRKPLPGMLLEAAREFCIDLKESFMIGDILHDVEAGNRAGCQTILLDVGNETEWVSGPYRKPGYTAKSWNEITAVVLEGVCNNEGV